MVTFTSMCVRVCSSSVSIISNLVHKNRKISKAKEKEWKNKCAKPNCGILNCDQRAHAKENHECTPTKETLELESNRMTRSEEETQCGKFRAVVSVWERNTNSIHTHYNISFFSVVAFFVPLANERELCCWRFYLLSSLDGFRCELLLLLLLLLLSRSTEFFFYTISFCARFVLIHLRMFWLATLSDRNSLRVNFLLIDVYLLAPFVWAQNNQLLLLIQQKKASNYRHTYMHIKRAVMIWLMNLFLSLGSWPNKT